MLNCNIPDSNDNSLITDSSGFLSIILLMRDHESFIEDSLESILREFKSGIPIIIVDVGSVDNGLEIARNILSKHFTFFQIVSLSRNTRTLKVLEEIQNKIKSKYAVLLSSDDVLGLNYGLVAMKLAKESIENCNYNFKLVVTDEDLSPQKLQNPKWLKRRIFNKLILSIMNPGTAPGALLHWPTVRYVFDNFEVPDILIEDYWLWWHLIKFSNFKNISETTVLYRKHGNNLSKSRFSQEYAFSLGAVSATAWSVNFNPFYGLLSLIFLPRWLKYLHFSMWPFYCKGYIYGFQFRGKSKHIKHL